MFVFLLVLSSVGFVYANGDTFGKKEVVDKTQQVSVFNPGIKNFLGIGNSQEEKVCCYAENFNNKDDYYHTSMVGSRCVNDKTYSRKIVDDVNCPQVDLLRNEDPFKVCCNVANVDYKTDYKFINKGECSQENIGHISLCKINYRCDLLNANDVNLPKNQNDYNFGNFCISKNYKLCSKVMTIHGGTGIGCDGYKNCKKIPHTTNNYESVDFYLGDTFKSNEGLNATLVEINFTSVKLRINDFHEISLDEGEEKDMILGMSAKLEKINFNNNPNECFANTAVDIVLKLNTPYSYNDNNLVLSSFSDDKVNIKINEKNVTIKLYDNEIVDNVRVKVTSLNNGAAGLTLSMINKKVCKAKLNYYNDVVYNWNTIKVTNFDFEKASIDINGKHAGDIRLNQNEVFNGVQLYLKDIEDGNVILVIGKKEYATIFLPVTKNVGELLQCDYEGKDIQEKGLILGFAKCCTFD